MNITALEMHKDAQVTQFILTRSFRKKDPPIIESLKTISEEDGPSTSTAWLSLPALTSLSIHQAEEGRLEIVALAESQECYSEVSVD